jgi:arylsulfatase A-like enzyme
MTRKEFLRLVSTVLALRATPGMAAGEIRSGGKPIGSGLASEAASEAAEKKGKRRPNVLIIMTDQHRRNYMTAAGNPIVPTPNIDRIASRGVRFTNAVCPYPVCLGSRMAFMSGNYAHTTGAIANTDLLPWKTPTMAHHFANQGYHTGVIGKMHFNDGHHHGFQYSLGFNDWFMYLGPKVQNYADECANDFMTPQFFKSITPEGSGFGLPELPGVWGSKRPWDGHVKRIGLPSEFADPEDEFDSFVARESCRFLERYGKDDEPFLLLTSFLKPHSPCNPPHPSVDHYPADKVKLPPIGDITQYPQWIQKRIARFQALGSERLRNEYAGHLGNLAFVDTCIGRVYQKLEELGLSNDTIVIYTSDHGDMYGDHGLMGKFCLFDPSVGVPLIVSQPGQLPEGMTSDALVEYFGIFPTIAELTGVPPPTNIDAQSFAQLVRDPGAAGPEAQFAEFNLRSANDCYMVRTKRFKYNYNHGDIPELYDLDGDPSESVNQAENASFAKIRSELHDRMMAWYDPATNSYRRKNSKP